MITHNCSIILPSCIGKLFTTVLNNRIAQFATVAQLVSETQAGFRDSHTTLSL